MLTNGEEIGWRGYILPRLLDRHNALVASLILAGLGHLACAQVSLGRHGGQRHAYPFWIFALNILAFTILLTWVFVRARQPVARHAVSRCKQYSRTMPTRSAGRRAFYIMVALHCLIALIIARSRTKSWRVLTYAKLRPHTASLTTQTMQGELTYTVGTCSALHVVGGVLWAGSCHLLFPVRRAGG